MSPPFGKRVVGSNETELVSVWSRDMRLRVAAPSGGGWQRMEAGRCDDGLICAIKCIRGMVPNALVLNAHLYALAPKPLCSAQDLCALPHRQRWLASAFSRIDSIDINAVDYPPNGRACALKIEGQGQSPDQPLCVRERQLRLPAQFLVLTAAGPPDQMELEGAVCTTWLTTAHVAA